jgi:hypothetical protein
MPVRPASDESSKELMMTIILAEVFPPPIDPSPSEPQNHDIDVIPASKTLRSTLT